MIKTTRTISDDLVLLENNNTEGMGACLSNILDCKYLRSFWLNGKLQGVFGLFPCSDDTLYCTGAVAGDCDRAVFLKFLYGYLHNTLKRLPHSDIIAVIRDDFFNVGDKWLKFFGFKFSNFQEIDGEKYLTYGIKLK